MRQIDLEDYPAARAPVELHRLRKVFTVLRPGAILIYHVGHLATDTLDRPDLAAIRELMVGLSARRLGRLSQRRLEDGVYEYRIEKAAVPTATAQQPKG